jgi:hypothetical protein
MSPVPRGRKPKKRPPDRAERSRPEWFGASVRKVLDAAVVLRDAQGPRELEQQTAALLGEELAFRLEHEETGLAFAWWADELAEAAVAQLKQASRGDDWETPLRLLHGLSSISTAELQSIVRAGLGHAKKWLKRVQRPKWLDQLDRIEATGDIWGMRDAYGVRFAVIAGFTYPHETDPSVFLFDIDASGFLEIASAGVFDNQDQAADAWRAHVGDTAAKARLGEVEDDTHLLVLAHCRDDRNYVMGNESRNLLDNWFRAQRRICDLSAVVPLPHAESLFDDAEVSPLVDPFFDWYTDRHGSAPDLDAVVAMAEEWVEGALPSTWFSISPLRVRHQLALISDWHEDSTAEAVKILLPLWVRWLGERAGLPEVLIERAVAVAVKGYVPE